MALENTVGSSVGRAVGGVDGDRRRRRGLAGLGARRGGRRVAARAATYGDAFSRALLAAAEEDPRIVALTAAMPGPTGLLPFQARFPERFFDVGIAEQHEVTSAAGMAMAGLRPVVAVYSTFLQPRLRPGQPRRRPARLPRRLRARPGRRHRRRRAEPPRRAGPGAGALHPGHDGLRTVGRRGGGADAAHCPRAVRAFDHPLPEDGDRGMWTPPTSARAGGPAVALRRRVGLPHRRGQDGRGVPRRRGRAGGRGCRRDGVGRPGRFAARCRTCWPRRHAMGWS